MAEADIADTGPNERPEPLSVVSTDVDGIRVVTLSGEIDHDTGDTLRRALETSGVPRPRTVVDLHQVTFMDSSGINIFIAAHRALSEAGGWLRLAAVNESVMRTLSIVGLDVIVDCRDTVDQALGD
ncbi:STAS domain-containing protein [Streptomyces humi]|uniref:STAS domain-containing protein n=1 Tax=Streptomyces humi TaxID=1428620 RepID=UPI0009A12C56|nr:STAS domain-containing protein [Streptomyces humi]